METNLRFIVETRMFKDNEVELWRVRGLSDSNVSECFIKLVVGDHVDYWDKKDLDLETLDSIMDLSCIAISDSRGEYQDVYDKLWITLLTFLPEKNKDYNSTLTKKAV